MTNSSKVGTVEVQINNDSGRKKTTAVVKRGFSYDALGRPLSRRTARRGSVVNDAFSYNTRSELAQATVLGGSYGYAYDNIGNRKSAQELEQELTYEANSINQYASISEGDTPFVPTFDADGNQTLVKTSAGIWSVEYNAQNRPVRFTSQDEASLVECTYDYMGRRHTRKVMVNGAIRSHLRYLYRGFLQIAAIDALKGSFQWFLVWDPSESTATRPLAIRKDGTWYCYGWDLTKNVWEVFGSSGNIRTTYSYTPYGEVTAEGNVSQPVQWSSEMYDEDMGLVYYNYRHYNPHDGRWINRDPIAEQGGWNLYGFVENGLIARLDSLGAQEYRPTVPGGMNSLGTYNSPVYTPSNKGIAIKYISDQPGFDMAEWMGFLMYGMYSETLENKKSFQPNDLCKTGKCIYSLIVIAHGCASPDGSLVMTTWGTDDLFESDNQTDISKQFENLHFCKKCKVELRSCYLGKSKQLKERLETNTGCRIILHDTGVGLVG